MFLSLRTRLWFSYALLIGILLMVVAFALAVALLRNPLVYRSVLPQLRAIASEIEPKVHTVLGFGTERLQRMLEEDSARRDGIRTAVLDENGVTIADSMVGKAGALPRLNPEEYPHLVGGNRPGLVRDLKRRVWVFWTEDLGQGETLWVAMRLPRLPLVQLLRNDVAAPLIYAGIIAFLAASLLALGMGSWIAAPLQRMVRSSREMATGKNVTIPEEGPGEVRELARALNEMHHQVHTSLQSQQEVLQSQRDFVANVSHELKTPLTSIQGFAQAILDGAVQTPEGLHSSAEVIYQESTRMHRLVLDLLTLARLEAGTAELQHDQLDMTILLKNVILKFRPQAQAAQVDLSCEIPQLPTMSGDGDRLAQVFTNLVDNALKFSLPHGQVGIRAAATANGVLVEVWDTGKGIAEGERERVFERFYQVEKSRRGGSERGLGLGLPIARQIVQAHGGRIWVEGMTGSQNGSRFFVLLPPPRPDDKTLAGRRS
jgi:signal transduction histidine kinase